MVTIRAFLIHLIEALTSSSSSSIDPPADAIMISIVISFPATCNISELCDICDIFGVCVVICYMWCMMLYV